MSSAELDAVVRRVVAIFGDYSQAQVLDAVLLLLIRAGNVEPARLPAPLKQRLARVATTMASATEPVTSISELLDIPHGLLERIANALEGEGRRRAGDAQAKLGIESALRKDAPLAAAHRQDVFRVRLQRQSTSDPQ